MIHPPTPFFLYGMKLNHLFLGFQNETVHFEDYEILHFCWEVIISYKLYTSPNVFGQGSTGDEPMADFQLPALLYSYWAWQKRGGGHYAVYSVERVSERVSWIIMASWYWVRGGYSGSKLQDLKHSPNIRKRNNAGMYWIYSAIGGPVLGVFNQLIRSFHGNGI